MSTGMMATKYVRCQFAYLRSGEAATHIPTLSAYLAERAWTVAEPIFPLDPITKTTGFAISVHLSSSVRFTAS